ncbi:hypothetical protein FOA43_002646 [Brettanomyces nanus]|uniref:Xylanolytic transcriptional activator regulatory domain-containing protein n=1 Tax=Eeniella nana TaxID=13502 RepID=A0A875S4J8_EENNA|nr:uncharacterized protein FOA43_002646 [Brettanomyces nanus]QPG75295.1 hypothetical protein FOA43_002646 [Brettanomyces nanus]
MLCTRRGGNCSFNESIQVTRPKKKPSEPQIHFYVPKVKQNDTDVVREIDEDCRGEKEMSNTNEAHRDVTSAEDDNDSVRPTELTDSINYSTQMKSVGRNSSSEAIDVCTTTVNSIDSGVPLGASESLLSTSEYIPNLENQPPVTPIQSYEFDLPLTIDMWNIMFQDLQNDSLHVDMKNTRLSSKAEANSQVSTVSSPFSSSVTKAGSSALAPTITVGDIQQLPSFHLQSQGINRFGVCSLQQIRKYIKGSVDADEAIKVQYLTENSYMDPYIYTKLAHEDEGPVEGEFSGGEFPVPTSRRSPTSRLGSFSQMDLSGVSSASDESVFYRKLVEQTPDNIHSTGSSILLVRNDPGMSRQDVATKEKIRALIGSFGPRLLLIYFRYINPFLPLFSRGLFYFGTNQNMLEFHNSLLATLLTLGMDYWAIDPVLQQYTPPSDITLFKIARSAMMEEQEMPNYSSLQACILLSQKRPVDLSKPDTPFVWTVLGMAASLAETMGYNHECLEWHIPSWDKRLRRRIWWCFLVQDTWFAACYGLPLHIASRYWHVSPLTPNDFESYSMNERDSENFKLSVVSFCFMVNISSLVATICDEFLYSHMSSFSFETIYRMGWQLLDKVTAMEEDSPRSLQVSSQITGQIAWANASIQLAIQAAKLIILRHLLHKLKASDERSQHRYRDSIFDSSLDCLRSILCLVGKIKADHFQYFWYSWSRLNFALAANFFLLVYSLVESAQERDTVKGLLDNYRWWLRCNNSSFSDLSLALAVLDRAYAEGLERIAR